MGWLSECSSGGCGAKIGPGELRGFLEQLKEPQDPNLLVGFNASDDAAVYRLDDERALVSTVDFFSPMVEDPRLFGSIAAANALSDVYAMGGKPLYALNLVCCPHNMDKSLLGDMLAGGAEKVAEAGAVIAGGHSIYDHEPKYGLAVTGVVHPGRVLRNNGCQPGDVLILTKALGVGLVMSALRGGEASPQAVDAATASMQRLNRWAAEKMADYPVNACTDVTGFGLLVHACEMAGDSVSIEIDADSLPLLPGAREYAEAYLATAAGQRNREYAREQADFGSVAPAMQELVLDPQTSGGLLISLPAAQAAGLCSAIQRDDPAAAMIGQVVPKRSKSVILL